MKRTLLCATLLLATRAFAAEPVFDMHVHLRDYETSLLKYESEVRADGIELSAIGVMWFGGEHQAPAGNPAGIRAGNDKMIALAAKHPEVVPIATVHPYDGKAALDELARVSARGIKVLKIHPHTQRFAISEPRVLATVTKAGELGMAVLMDNAGIVPGDCEDLFNLAVQAPKTRFIFAHMGGANFRFWNILVLARTADGFGLDNVNFDISGTVLLAADSPIEAEFVWTLRNVGISHVMLGSDYPQISLKRMVDALDKLDLTPEEKTGIMSGNARRVLGGNGIAGH
ncbi:MAG TPA: amidohydrolase family protein [Steroidobacteraceae bacterium]